MKLTAILLVSLLLTLSGCSSYSPEYHEVERISVETQTSQEDFNQRLLDHGKDVNELKKRADELIEEMIQ